LYKIFSILISVLAVAIFYASNASALNTEEKTHRIEASFSFEYLKPHTLYGEWKTGNLSFYSKQSPSLTYFLQGSLYNRLEGNGETGTIGAYKDWADYVYTYSSITSGSQSTYLPKIRIDHDFNFKIGEKKNYILTSGVTYIRYFDDHRDLIISGGTTIYLNKLILQYRIFHNESKPGSIESYSHLLSVGYGEEGQQWTYLNVSSGKQAYLATSLATPQAVNQDSFNLTLKNRHWLDRYYGVFGEAGYFKLEDGYKKFNISFGIFYAF
jgi:YaiO family outer membrane protein